MIVDYFAISLEIIKNVKDFINFGNTKFSADLCTISLRYAKSAVDGDKHSPPFTPVGPHAVIVQKLVFSEKKEKKT